MIKGLSYFAGRSRQSSSIQNGQGFEMLLLISAIAMYVSLTITGMLCSHARNFTIKRTMTKTFGTVSNDIKPILVARLLGDEC